MKDFLKKFFGIEQEIQTVEETVGEENQCDETEEIMSDEELNKQLMIKFVSVVILLGLLYFVVNS